MRVKDYCFWPSEQKRELEKNMLTLSLPGSFSWLAEKEGKWTEKENKNTKESQG